MKKEKKSVTGSVLCPATRELSTRSPGSDRKVEAEQRERKKKGKSREQDREGFREDEKSRELKRKDNLIAAYLCVARCPLDILVRQSSGKGEMWVWKRLRL